MLKNTTISDKQGNISEAIFEWDQTTGEVFLHCSISGLNKIKAFGANLFDSLSEIRKALEKPESPGSKV